MSRVLFIDDERDVIAHYLNIFPKAGMGSSSALKALASDFFVDENFESANDDYTSAMASIRPLTATQGLDGVEIVRKCLKEDAPVQVAFIDMRMPPGIDGFETAKHIRSIDPNIEIVIVTAYSDVRPEKFLKDLGPSDKIIYLRKPFDTAEIRQLILNLTSKYRMERIKEEFIGNVTHELKTPLASILGFSELLMEKVTEDQEGLEYAKILLSNGKLMQTLVSDLLLTFSASRGKIKISPEKSDLGQILKEAVQSVRPLVPEEIELSITLPPTSFTTDVDPIRFRQVLNNILSNSLKFTSKGKVSVNLEESDAEIVVSVKDTGIGIAQENLDRIFEKFFRVENEHHEKPGLGLGLSIVAEILKAHRFRWKVVSALGEGTEFRIIIPKDKA